VGINLKVAERGRQQISFNGGLSGIGGSFFGLDYSTNNLLGRGEVLSLQLAAGNRQKSVQFSFTEPYIRNRPITAGFQSLLLRRSFSARVRCFRKTLMRFRELLANQFDFFNVSEENLFTRDSYGASVFASAPLSEFYRKPRIHAVFRASAFLISSRNQALKTPGLIRRAVPRPHSFR